MDIVKMLISGGIFTAIAAIFANLMGWLRFSKNDKAQVNKIEAEAALDRATITEKKISDEVKISDAALQWTINCFSRLEQANLMIDKKQEENDRLHGIIDVMKQDFERDIKKIKEDFDGRIKQIEKEFEKSKTELMREREENRQEIIRLKNQINGNN